MISYAHRDQALKDELIVHLSPLRRQGIITDWHDRNINAGADWKKEIDTHLDTAGMILLLVSPDFIASDYCYEIEMKRALERHYAGECRVIPVFLRGCDWKGSPFGRLQDLPDDAIPVVSAQWPTRDDAFLRVARGSAASLRNGAQRKPQTRRRLRTLHQQSACLRHLRRASKRSRSQSMIPDPA